MKAKKDEYLRIVHLSDTQLGFTDSRNRYRLAEELKVPEEELDLHYTEIDKEYYKLAVKEINKLDPKPDVVINTGDLIDSPENRKSWADYQQVTNTINSLVFEVIGNHDGPVDRGKDYYSFMLKNVVFIALNSQFLKDNDDFPEEFQKQKRFIEKELSDNRAAKNIILLMHHPLSTNEIIENEDYFFLPPRQRDWIIELVEKFNIRAVLSGHLHHNDILKHNNTELITTGSISEPLGNDCNGEMAKRGFRVLDINLETSAMNHKFIKLN